MKIILAGPKGTGKSTLAGLLGKKLLLPVVETDREIERLYAEEQGGELSCREICREKGETFFRALERKSAGRVGQMDWCIISTGGSTLLDCDSRRELRKDAVLVLLTASADKIIKRLRIGPGNMPSYLVSDNPAEEFRQRVEKIIDVLTPYADVILNTEDADVEGLCNTLAEMVSRELEARAGSFSSFGTIVRVSTFGESHGVALGAILDGVRPGIPLCAEDIQHELDRRRPGQSDMTTSRREPDSVEILSGVFDGVTTGAPVGMIIRNKDQDSSKYDNLKDLFRPGHADFTFWKKYGVRDHRGGGRSSGRETCARVMSGAVALKALSAKGISLTAYAVEVAGVKAAERDFSEIEKNALRAPDSAAAEKMAEAVRSLKANGDSAGGVVELCIRGCPAGLGDPVFGKLDARLAQAMFSLGAVKGVEFGAGFAAARMSGIEFNDSMRDESFESNRAGGILGGISSGENIICRLAVKPTPSVSVPQKTVNKNGENFDVTIEGRHDPCIVPRIIPVVESMAALVILDLLEIQERLRG